MSGRWEAGILVTLALALAGLVAREGVLLLAAAIPLIYVAYGSYATASVPSTLSARRTIDPSTAPPGRPVAVELTLTNDSNRTLSDVRFVDRVPEELAVSLGSPRTGTVLEPGETVSVSYEVIPRRGTFAFDPPRVRVRSAGAGATATETVPVEGDTSLVCRLDAEAPPLHEEGTGFVGRMTTDSPGRGLEFHSTREYRRGDSAERIDWRGYAKRNELQTVNYARHVSASVVLVLDARPPCHVVAGPGRPTALELAAYAATQALSDLLRAGSDVGVAVLGLEGPGPSGLHWMPPAGGERQRAQAVDIFDDAIALGKEVMAAEDGWRYVAAQRDAAFETRSGVTRQAEQLVELTPPGSQFVMFSPLLDQVPVDIVETWAAFDIPLTILSPDVVPANTLTGQLDGGQRHIHLANCQAAGARTVDWRRGTPLPVALERAFAANARLAAGGAASASPGGVR